MKIKLSNEMLRCIERTKRESLILLNESSQREIIKIKKKPTKNKSFEFHIFNFGKPMIRLFINDRFYSSFFYNDGKWSEER